MEKTSNITIFIWTGLVLFLVCVILLWSDINIYFKSFDLYETNRTAENMAVALESYVVKAPRNMVIKPQKWITNLNPFAQPTKANKSKSIVVTEQVIEAQADGSFRVAFGLDNLVSGKSPNLRLDFLDTSDKIVRTEHFSPNQYTSSLTSGITRYSVVVRKNLHENSFTLTPYYE